MRQLLQEIFLNNSRETVKFNFANFLTEASAALAGAAAAAKSSLSTLMYGNMALSLIM